MLKLKHSTQSKILKTHGGHHHCVHKGYLLDKKQCNNTWHTMGIPPPPCVQITHSHIWTHTDQTPATITRSLSCFRSFLFFFFFFFLSNLIFYRAHSSTLTIGRVDSAEGHPDIRAEWMTFRVQFPSFLHHFFFFERPYSTCEHVHATGPFSQPLSSS